MFYRLWYQNYLRYQSVTRVFRVLYQKRIFVKVNNRINYLVFYQTHRGFTLKGSRFVFNGSGMFISVYWNDFLFKEKLLSSNKIPKSYASCIGSESNFFSTVKSIYVSSIIYPFCQQKFYEIHERPSFLTTNSTNVIWVYKNLVVKAS